jgi:hypothetical protein
MQWIIRDAGTVGHGLKNIVIAMLQFIECSYVVGIFAVR